MVGGEIGMMLNFQGQEEVSGTQEQTVEVGSACRLPTAFLSKEALKKKNNSLRRTLISGIRHQPN